jgi:hypothetical protein
MGLFLVFGDNGRYVPPLEERTIATETEPESSRLLRAILYGNQWGLYAPRRKPISGKMPLGQGLTILK